MRWLTDEDFVVDDETRFESGRVERRRFFCRLETPNRIAVTSGELPDGAEAQLGPGGYRIAPFRSLARLGPLLVPVTCHDHYRLGDGKVIETIDVQLLGVPLARIVVKATVASRDGERPVGGATARSL